jgi:hypothetical protein
MEKQGIFVGIMQLKIIKDFNNVWDAKFEDQAKMK